MTFKALLAAATLATAPLSAVAMCSGYKHQQQAMTCTDGTVYDSATNSCKTVTG